MGRKPNPLILNYFDRGAKLEDASNRYQHTCKACGEQFPKGRIDSLTAHLTRKCPSLSLPQRTAIVLQLHDLADPAEPKTSPRSGNKLDKAKPVSLPYSQPKQTFNGLNVLAEASRRVGANERPEAPGYAAADQVAGQNLAVDPALDVDGFPHAFLNTSDDGLGTRINGFPSTTTPGMPSMFSYMSPDVPISQNESAHLSGMPISESDMGSQAPDLPSIAASANEILPMHPDLEMSQEAINAAIAIFDDLNNGNASNGNMGIENSRQQFSWPTLPRTQSIDQAVPEPMSLDPPSEASLNRPVQAIRPLAIHPSDPRTKSNHFITGSGSSSQFQKPKVRGRFSSERRKEVQRIRRLGACLRCRMLKKSCTGSDPCDACKAVENPRLWKHPCVRTKLTAEFGLFFVGLQSTLSYHDIQKFKESVSLQTFDGHIEAFHFEGSSIVVTFKGLQGQLFGPGVHHHSQARTAINENTCLLLDSERDNVADKVEQYLKEVRSSLFSYEKSPLLKTTLETALRLGNEKNDVLLNKVIELWSATLMLVDTECSWKLIAHAKVESEAADAGLLSAIPIDAPQDQRIALTGSSSPYSFSLINSQLRAAVEKRAAALARTVLGDLERRLLQRQQNGHFETFLVAILFLNCVERVTWMFRIWETETRTTWPLDKLPEAYAQEGEQFAQILDMLMEMRSLPPKTAASSEVDVLMPQEHDDIIKQWFEEIAITPAFLKRCVESNFSVGNCRSMDGQFFARILRPESERTKGTDK